LLNPAQTNKISNADENISALSEVVSVGIGAELINNGLIVRIT